MPNRSSSSGKSDAAHPSTSIARFSASAAIMRCLRRSRRATTSANAWFPPCELYRISFRMPARATHDPISSHCVAAVSGVIPTVPANPPCSQLTPMSSGGNARTRTSWRTSSSARASSAALCMESTPRGRCGPCASVAPRGNTATASPRSAVAKSSVVHSDHSLLIFISRVVVVCAAFDASFVRFDSSFVSSFARSSVEFGFGFWFESLFADAPSLCASLYAAEKDPRGSDASVVALPSSHARIFPGFSTPFGSAPDLNPSCAQSVCFIPPSSSTCVWGLNTRMSFSSCHRITSSTLPTAASASVPGLSSASDANPIPPPNLTTSKCCTSSSTSYRLSTALTRSRAFPGIIAACRYVTDLSLFSACRVV
mmetsp:Transcript_15479/g.60576  ORF Transcript_15479/g.60576 Transcript_15479/m.60576 type:complete len:369 (+) Transcript_15479:397-1503(+)